MIFYLPSFSVDWVRGTREEMKRSKLEIKLLKDSEETSRIKIKQLTEDVQELKKKLK